MPIYLPAATACLPTYVMLPNYLMLLLACYCFLPVAAAACCCCCCCCPLLLRQDVFPARWLEEH